MILPNEIIVDTSLAQRSEVKNLMGGIRNIGY